MYKVVTITPSTKSSPEHEFDQDFLIPIYLMSLLIYFAFLLISSSKN